MVPAVRSRLWESNIDLKQPKGSPLKCRIEEMQACRPALLTPVTGGGGRIEDERLLRGKGQFTGDDCSPALSAHFVRSPFAHAEIGAINLEAAKLVPGVVAALSAIDLATHLPGMAPVIDVVEEAGGVRHVPQRPALAAERALFAGEAIGVILARTAHAAADGAEAALVDFSDLVAVASVDDAARLPPIHPSLPNNLGFDWQGGDPSSTEAVFASAAFRVAAMIEVPRMHGLPLEPAGARASYDAGSGRWTLVAPSQGVHAFRRELADSYLRVPLERLRVVTPDVGGAFGLRIHALPEHAVLLAAARLLGQDVAWSATRAESMLAEPHSRGLSVSAELALDRHGTILALRAVSRCDLGAYVHVGSRSTPTSGMLFGLQGPYRIQAISVRVQGYYTNTAPTGPFRGAGQPEGAFVLERMIDIAASRCCFDPVSLRRRNLLGPADFPYLTRSGYLVDSGNPPALLERTLSELGPAAAGEGTGIAMYLKVNGMGRSEKAEVEVRPDDGKIVVRIGSQSNGQGHETTFARLAAARLDVPLAQVEVVQGDSDAIAHGTGTGASSALGTTGPGVQLSADDLLRQARKLASDHLGIPPEELTYAAGAFAVAGNRHVSLHELALAGARLVGRSEVDVTLSFTFGCHACIVSADTDTGEPKVTRYAACDDLGRLLEPVIARGQVHGGIAQGIGQALFEGFAYDTDTAQPVSATLMDYAVPRASDLPDLRTSFASTVSTANRLGVRGAGEAGALCSMAAVANATAAALSLSGEPRLAAPLTGARIWEVLRCVTRDGMGG